jgi:hypothetical protein
MSTPSSAGPNSSSWIDHSRYNNAARKLDMLINDVTDVGADR